MDWFDIINSSTTFGLLAVIAVGKCFWLLKEILAPDQQNIKLMEF